ncbi:hypothetical protein [Kitasatospora sp. A2-31]|nr:hypothetical protein [Kitasatospora sp. A2-31]MCG6494379.1 hypothetical protein [Kitasatospora sp. A2-31]MCG6500504.1 hypothetical protein [Kitasatospora sp. A2-31]
MRTPRPHQPRPHQPRRPPPPGPSLAADTDAGHGVQQLEGYLYWQAETEEARQAARDLADHLPWLTGTQRHDLEHHYTRAHLHVSRAYLTRLRGRRDELRAEYEARYRHLRARCVLTALLVTTTAVLCAVLSLIHR